MFLCKDIIFARVPPKESVKTLKVQLRAINELDKDFFLNIWAANC